MNRDATLVVTLTCDQEFSSGTLVLEGWGISMDWQVLVSLDWTLLVNWVSNNVHNSSEGLWTDWHHNGVTSVPDFLSSDESLCGIQSDSSHVVATQMLSDFQNQFVLDSLHFECIENWWQIAFELNIDYSTNDLGHFSHSHYGGTEASYKRCKRLETLVRQEARTCVDSSLPFQHIALQAGMNIIMSGYLLLVMSLESIFLLK